MLWKRKLRVGDWVEIRSKEEILRTLDRKGQLDGMPFMPEMLAFCGKRFQVYKRAHKTCDTVFPVRGRRVADAIHLDTRCDGSAHDGCNASCLLFWKSQWLKSVDHPIDATQNPDGDNMPCTEADLYCRTRTADPNKGRLKYTCQATQLPYASTDLDWWDIRQYIEDYVSGNVGLGRILSGGIYMAAYALSRAGVGLGRPIRSFYDRFYHVWGGAPFPRRTGAIPDGQ